MDAHFHALSCVRKWGGAPDDYIRIHEWFDETAAHFDHFTHRALRHHSLGVREAVEKFGRTITISTGRVIPVKQIAERHVNEDLGFVPTVADWLRHLRGEPWMKARKVRRVSI